MNIEHIRAFLEVTATGSFQVAAEKLHVAQSTVSARIKALEDRLNRTLFSRKRNGVELTAGGHHFLPHANNVIRAWERAQHDVGLPEGLIAMISLGVESNHWGRFVSPWLQWMANFMPDIGTSVVTGTSDGLMQRMRTGLLDVAILCDPQHCVEVSFELLLTEELVMVSTEPRSVEVGGVPGYILVDWGGSFRAQHRAYFPGVSSHKLTVEHAAVALDHILTYGGSGYFLGIAVSHLIEEGRLHFVTEAPILQCPVFLCIRADSVSGELIENAASNFRSNVKMTEMAGNHYAFSPDTDRKS